MNKFQEERNIFIHERAGGSMTVLPYFFSKMLTEMPSFIIFPSLLSLIVYFMTDLRRTVNHFFIFMVTICIQAFTSSSLMIAVGALAPTPEIGLIIAPVANMIFLLFSGFLINLNNIPVWYRWLNYISFFRYSLEILLSNEFSGNVYQCVNNSLFNFSNCQFNNGTYQYLGDTELSILGMSSSRIWSNFLVLIGEIILFRLIALTGIYFLHKERA